MLDERIQKLIDSGFVREQFVDAADSETAGALEAFAQTYAKADKKRGERQSVGDCLMRYGVLSPQLIENIITANYRYTVFNWAESLGSPSFPALQKLLEEKKLDTSVACQLLNDWRKPFVGCKAIERLEESSIAGASNIINFGLKDIFECEAVKATILTRYPRRDEFLTERNPLLRATRATEFLPEKRQQVELVVSPIDPRPLLTQMDTVWRHYAAQSEFFKRIEAEPPEDAQIRAQNVARVNKRQAQKMKNGKSQPSDKRFIDIYARYNAAEMDPFMLTMIARTVKWYMDNGHARLFTHMRLVPDRIAATTDGSDAMPWVALAVCPNMKVLRVEGEGFKTSLLGANRLFLTHSKAKEATAQHSIPIIGLATWKNINKYKVDQPYALLAADFDHGDLERYSGRAWTGVDNATSITGVIEETLRALRQVEDLEIASAHGIRLELGLGYRWQPVVANHEPRRNLFGFGMTILGRAKKAALAL